MKLSLLIFTVALVILSGTMSIAMSPGSTSQTWTFSTDAQTAIAPDLSANAFGSATATIAVDADTGTGWTPSGAGYGSAQGLWDIGIGSITLSVPSAGADLEQDINIKIIYWLDISQAPTVGVPSASFLGTSSVPTGDATPPGSWYMDVWTFHVGPNSGFNTITIDGDMVMGSQIDEITVSTSVVPEPSSLIAILSLGVSGMICARRRRS